VCSIRLVYSVCLVYLVYPSALRPAGVPPGRLEDRSASALPAPRGAPACALHADRRQAGKALRETPPPR